jgi:hypothetical protein
MFTSFAGRAEGRSPHGFGQARWADVPPAVGARSQEGDTVKIHRLACALAAVAAVLALGTGAALASSAKVVVFAASYSGTATVKVTDTVADITATGPGKATGLGAGKITGVGKGDTSVQPCVPFTGPGTMVGTGKNKLTFKVIAGSTACGDEAGEVFSVSGKATVVKGFGALAKAKGTLKFSGVYDRGAGTFSVKFKGKLTQ